MAEATMESFEALLEESLSVDSGLEGQVLRGTIVSVDGDFALVDVGLKSEGRVNLKEFSRAGEEAELRAGDEVEVFVERYEDRDGQIVLSRDKARREEAWNELEKASNDGARVDGVIFGRVRLAG
jgi:small subunit ribosomal protein S1